MDVKDLYDLTSEEFERLVGGLLSVSGYTDVRFTAAPVDNGIDIIAKRNDEIIAVQVKHKMRLTTQEVRTFADRYFRNSFLPQSLIFVTSADIPSSTSMNIDDDLPEGYSFRLLGRQDVLGMIDQHPNVANRYFARAERRRSSQRTKILSSTTFALLAAVVGFVSSYYTMIRPKPPLDERIETVEKALTSIRDLETYMGKIKQDMVETEKATQILKEKYTRAKELERLTQPQVDALRSALQAQNWRHTVLNWAVGLIFGVASSFVGSVLLSKWRQRRALE